MITCSHLCNKHETCTAFAFDPALKCSFVNGTQNLVKTSKKNPEALKLGIANYPSLSLVPHFLILHDSNKLEDYSLDPVISPPIEYGSWPIEIFPPSLNPTNQRGFASVLMSDMTINVRQYEYGFKPGKNYFHWNFEKNSDPVAFSTVQNDIAYRNYGAVASGFGKIYIHSGEQDPGKKIKSKNFQSTRLILRIQPIGQFLVKLPKWHFLTHAWNSKIFWAK